MKIKEFGIAYYKSFDSEGAYISLEKNINIFIGRNNSGKSNFLKFIKLFSDHYGNFKNFPIRELENQYHRNGQNPILIVSINLAEVWKDYADILCKDKIYKFKFTIPNFDIVGEHPLGDYEPNFLVNLQNYYSSAGKEDLLKQIHGIILNEIMSELSFLKKLIYIPHFREISNKSESDNIFSGNKIISKLFEMKNPAIGEEENRLKFEKIQNFLRDLLTEKDLTLDIPHSKDRIIIEINKNRLSLESLGTGIHELVILCSALTLYDDHCFCIEEPELHLHPSLQRKFLDFIQSMDNYFFISTHSNTFLDYRQKTNIFTVTHNGSFSKIRLADTNYNKSEILNDLGYKASDILQSNGIIWVEGPSDRTYIKKWLDLMEPSFIEGINYSIMFYGGRLLSHLSFEENELINLLRLNRNAVVVIDRDGISPKTKINSTKRRIESELNNDSCWITKGREIENYLTENTIKSFLSDKITNPKFKYNLNKKLFENIINSNRKLKLDYSSDKVKYSKEISNHIRKNDLNILDLKKRIEFIISKIKTWNE